MKAHNIMINWFYLPRNVILNYFDYNIPLKRQKKEKRKTLPDWFYNKPASYYSFLPILLFQLAIPLCANLLVFFFSFLFPFALCKFSFVNGCCWIKLLSRFGKWLKEDYFPSVSVFSYSFFFAVGFTLVILWHWCID